MLRRSSFRHFNAVSVASFSLNLLLAAVASVVIPGCGGKAWHSETYPARGRVSINGAPAGGAVVELHSTGETKPDVRNSRPWAVVQEDGSYALSTYETGDGAPPGDYAIVLRWPPDVNQPTLVDRLGGAYSRPAESKWGVTITEGDNELPLVEVTGAKVLPKAQAGAGSQRPAGPPMGG